MMKIVAPIIAITLIVEWVLFLYLIVTRLILPCLRH